MSQQFFSVIAPQESGPTKVELSTDQQKAHAFARPIGARVQTARVDEVADKVKLEVSARGFLHAVADAIQHMRVSTAGSRGYVAGAPDTLLNVSAIDREKHSEFVVTLDNGQRFPLDARELSRD